MSVLCIYCNTSIISPEKDHRCITGDTCSECIENIFSQQDDLIISFLDNMEAAVLLMQEEPRQVITANKKACELFEKDLSEIERRRGGQVFDCIHSFTEAGCGADENCEECKIKDSVIQTFKSGESFNGVSTVLDIMKDNIIKPYNLNIATEKVRDFALIRIDKYEILD